MTKLTRRQRRANARMEGVKFVPMYNGDSPISMDEYKALNEALREKEATN